MDMSKEALDALERNADVLLDLDAKGVLVPHGIGGLARGIIGQQHAAITALRSERDEAASALAAREAASHRAGKLEGLREAADVCNAYKEKAHRQGRGDFIAHDMDKEAILALVERIEKGWSDVRR